MRDHILPRHTYSTEVVFLTFDSDLGRGLDHAQGGYGHTCVIGRLPDVSELQDIAANRHLLFPGQLHLGAHPLDIRHGSTNRNTCQVDAAARHHLMIGGGNGETGRHTTNCKGKKRYCERTERGGGGWGGLLPSDFMFEWPGLDCTPMCMNW